MAGSTIPVCAIVGIIIIIALLVYFCVYRNSESYSNIGDITNVGALEDEYQVVGGTYEQQVPSVNFADLIDCGVAKEIAGQPSQIGSDIDPMQRLERLQGKSIMPRVSKGVTPYNVDVADPATYLFQVSPRVVIKSRQYEQSDPIRGDIPINYCPNVCLISGSQYGRESQNFSGMFSDTYKGLYNKLTGNGYLNMPLKVAGEETILDNMC